MQAKRLQALEDEMTSVNAEYIQAVNRASASFIFFLHLVLQMLNDTTEDLHAQIKGALLMLLSETDAGLLEDDPFAKRRL